MHVGACVTQPIFRIAIATIFAGWILWWGRDKWRGAGEERGRGAGTGSGDGRQGRGGVGIMLLYFADSTATHVPPGCSARDN